MLNIKCDIRWENIRRLDFLTIIIELKVRFWYNSRLGLAITVTKTFFHLKLIKWLELAWVRKFTRSFERIIFYTNETIYSLNLTIKLRSWNMAFNIYYLFLCVWEEIIFRSRFCIFYHYVIDLGYLISIKWCFWGFYLKIYFFNLIILQNFIVNNIKGTCFNSRKNYFLFILFNSWEIIWYHLYGIYTSWPFIKIERFPKTLKLRSIILIID